MWLVWTVTLIGVVSAITFMVAAAHLTKCSTWVKHENQSTEFEFELPELLFEFEFDLVYSSFNVYW